MWVVPNVEIRCFALSASVRSFAARSVAVSGDNSGVLVWVGKNFAN